MKKMTKPPPSFIAPEGTCKVDKAKFLEQEYKSLREEIKETKARIFKLAGFGLVGMPAAYYIAQEKQIVVIALSLPLLICTLILLFIAESRALMRAGRYIKDCIEPVICADNNKDAKKLGWESWLEETSEGEQGRRTVDQIVTVFFYMLFLFYYTFSVWLSATTAQAKWGDIGLAITIAFYLFLGLGFIVILWMCFWYSTRTSKKK